MDGELALFVGNRYSVIVMLFVRGRAFTLVESD